MEIEKTLVLLKPDAIERGLVGEILSRFERVGLRLAAMKLLQSESELADQHYHDLGERISPRVKEDMVKFLISGPVLALVLEGVGAIAQVRKMVGGTYPNESAPGTIRGDYSHVSKDYANAQKAAVKNLIHASSDAADAERELKLWFSDAEFVDYAALHQKHTR